MGRFKIYDSQRLVKPLHDSNYVQCLICEKKLKNVMGNIKRHYQQVHYVYIIANANKTKKSKSSKHRSKYKQGDKSYKMYVKNNKSIDLNNQNDVQINDIINTGTTANNLIGSSANIRGCNNDLVSTSIVTMSEATDSDCILISDSDIKRKYPFQELYTANNTFASSTTKLDLKSPLSFTLASQKSKLKGEKETEIVLKHHLPTYNSNVKQQKLNEENYEIQIPCHSYINSIQISSLDSCRQVDFIKCLVDTKTQMNIPLKNFQKGDTFQEALQSWKQNFQFNYSSESVGENIDRMAKILRYEITKMVSNKLLFLKLDVLNTKESNVMFVNIQFINNFEIKVVTLSGFEIINADLVSILKKKVMITLERYKIDISRVFSITKDNSKNVRDIAETSFLDQERDDTSLGNEYTHHLCERFPGHAIHFVACDVIKQLEDDIRRIRNSARILRRQLSELNIKQAPVIDNVNSWFSVYDMIESVLNLRETVKSNSQLKVEIDWLFATQFIESFRPIVDTALLFQTSTFFVMGDFYREWLLCEIELKDLIARNKLALYLVEALQKHQTNFFENSLFLAALYLDPRFCFKGSVYLNESQKENAITQLLQIFYKLKEVNSSEDVFVNRNDRYSKLERHLKTSIETKAITNETVHLNDISYERLEESLKRMQFEERQPFKMNILDYWNMAKFKYPIVAKIAEIALAAPATQATIDKTLNLPLINLLKGKLNDSADFIDNLLLLKFNHELVDKIKLE